MADHRSFVVRVAGAAAMLLRVRRTADRVTALVTSVNMADDAMYCTILYWRFEGGTVL